MKSLGPVKKKRGGKGQKAPSAQPSHLGGAGNFPWKRTRKGGADNGGKTVRVESLTKTPETKNVRVKREVDTSKRREKGPGLRSWGARQKSGEKWGKGQLPIQSPGPVLREQRRPGGKGKRVGGYKPSFWTP